MLALRPVAAVGVLLAVAAAIMASLILMAGTTKSLLTTAELVSVNTSAIGADILKSINPLDRRDFLNDVKDGANNLKDGAKDLKDKASDKINEELNKLQGSIADALGLDDFYNIYIRDYCSGDYDDKAPNSPKKIKECSSDGKDSSSPGGLNLNKLIQEKIDKAKLPDAIKSKLKLPDDLQNGLKAVSWLFNASVVLGWIVICSSALTILFGCLYFWGHRAFLCDIFAAISACIACFMSMLWMILLLVFMTKSSSVISDKLKFLTVSASKGNTVSILLGALFVTTLVSALAWVATMMRYRHNKKKYGVYGYNERQHHQRITGPAAANYEMSYGR